MGVSRLNARLEACVLRCHPGDAGIAPNDDRAPLVIFDGDCTRIGDIACRVMRNDPGAALSLTPLQSALIRALHLHYGLDPDNPELNHLNLGGRAHGKVDVFARVMGVVRRQRPLRWLRQHMPGHAADRLYDVISRMRTTCSAGRINA